MVRCGVAFANLPHQHDANGNLTNLVYPGGRNVYYTFDSLNRLTNVTDWAGRKTSLTYDLDSHLTSLTRPNGTYRTMSYDAAGQLTNIWEQMANSLPIAWFRLNWTNSGNLAWEFAAPLPHTNTPPLRTMTYDADNQLSTVNGLNVTNDLDGNLTWGPLTNSTFAAYGYNARNQLTNAAGLAYGYDPAGNRVGFTSGTNSTELVVNPNAKLPQVLMRIKNGVTNYYVYGAGLLYQVTETATATNTLTYHYDYRGSTVALTADNGTVTDRIEYSLYGSMTYRVGTDDTPFLYNGRYGVMTDPNGLLYMRARYYNPYLCRFISADPSGFSGGLNFFTYANGNPVSYLDPFGLGALESDTGGSWVNQIASGLGVDNSLAAQQGRQDALVGAVNFATMGLANDASSAFTGYDLAGNRSTRQEQLASAVMLGLAFLPGGDVEAAGSRAATELGEVAAEGAGSEVTALTKFYPGNDGVAGATERTFLMPGQTIDRYGGSGYSRFFSPQGTADWARSLPPGTAGQPLRTFEVVKPFEVESGTVAPWFNQPGGGLQYRTPVNLDTLLKRGIINEVTP
jgi:RHS repeat-associated protein